MPYQPHYPVVETNPQVFLEIVIQGRPVGSLVFELFADEVPIAAENFRLLCTGSGGQSFKGSKFHRIFPSFFIEGGDFVHGDGTGGHSAFSERYFKDEAMTGKSLRHFGYGALSMSNHGPDTNSSLFFICLSPVPQFDTRHVVIGQMLSGVDVVRKIDRIGSSATGVPRCFVEIASCGEIVD